MGLNFDGLHELVKINTPSQKEGVNNIIQSCINNGITYPPQVAYVLATAYHETWYTMLPIWEKGLGKGMPYGVPDPTTHLIYYGRGYVQLTWKKNYEKFSKITGEDLVLHPEKCLNPAIAGKIMAIGMRDGLFTGVGLNKYIKDGHLDFINARRVINGLDKAGSIALYSQIFSQNLTS